MATIDDYKKDQQDRCVKMFHDVIANAPPVLLANNTEGDVCLYAPKICIDYLKTYYERHLTTVFSKEGNMKFMGYIIKESYMPEIVLVRKDYPIFLNPDMISRISIDGQAHK